MLFIRVDMNREIATGHLMRCLSVADAARTMGEETTFLLADAEAETYLSDRGYHSIILHTDWRNMEGELPALYRVLSREGIRRMLVDSYQVTETYLCCLRERTQVIYLDDLNLFHYPVDGLICYPVYAHKFHYPEHYPDTRLYLGTAYVPLRAEFACPPEKKIRGEIQKILILSGGTDSHNLIERVLEQLSGNPSLELDAVCGMYHPRYDALCARYAGNRHIRIHGPVRNIAEYMCQADMAISAGGTTLYELCSCGTPTISCVIADNQLENARAFEEQGLISCAGDIRTERIENRLSGLLEKYADPIYRKHLSDRMRGAVDGKGAARIAEILCAN